MSDLPAVPERDPDEVEVLAAEDGAAAPDDPVADAVAELSRVSAEAAELVEQVAKEEAAAASSTSGALVRAESADPVVAKRKMAELRSLAIRKQGEVQKAQERLKNELDRKMREARATLEPIQKMVERLTEGIWTFSLYLGRDEEILTLRDGEPAAAETPITVRQLVLSMDQETMVAAESGGMDARDMEQFDEWILANPAHLEQVLPEERGVVVLVPRITSRDYRDPWMQQAMDQANKQSYWLIRNGERLFRMQTDFNVGKRLIPTQTEFTDFFVTTETDWDTRERKTVPLTPGSRAWLEAEEKADARKRHYMRVALILQGLIDRTTVFHPLPAADLSLLSEKAYQAGYVNLVADDEMQLGAGRKPFREWLREKNAELRPGMRVVGAFNSEEFYSLRYDGNQWSRGGHQRIHPPNASHPTPGEVYTLDERKPDGGLVFRYDRTDMRYGYEHGDWGQWGEWPFKTRASCTVYPDDSFILPVDLVTADELIEYVNARTERHAYIKMVPLMKAVITAKREEAEAEAPFRELLIGEIVKAHDADREDAEAVVAELVDWWKLANRWHRPLVSPDKKTQAKAVRMIVAEYAARRAAADATSDQATEEQAMVEHLRRQYPDLMMVARKRDGGYVALAPEKRDFPDWKGATNVYAREYATGVTAKTVKEKRWVLVGARATKWRVLWSTPQWESWDTTATASAHLTDPEINEVVERLLATEATARRHQKPQVRPKVALAVTLGSELRFRVYRYNPRVWDEPEHLLSDPRPKVETHHLTAQARRSTGGKVVVDVDTWWSESEWGSRPRFSVRHVSESEPVNPAPWESRDVSVVWEDTAARAAAEAEVAQVADIERRRRRMAELSRAAHNAVREAWMAREEQKAYDRFIEDFADPDLWEGHRKTLRIQWPHHHPHYAADPLDTLFDRLVERGLDPFGHTVAESLALHDRVVEGVEPLDIPEDVLDLPVVRPESEGDGDDIDEDD